MSGIPLQTPPGYDMTTAQTCAYLNDVAGDMVQQWLNDGSPPEGQFDWTPTNSCPVTNGWLPLSDFAFAGPLWSTYTLLDHTYTEPFAIVAWAADSTTYIAFRGTRTTQDWFMDFDFKLVTYTPPVGSAPGAEVEAGFLGVFNGFGFATGTGVGAGTGMRAALTERYGAPAAPSAMIVTGHSLGSALATLTIPYAVADQDGPVLHYNSASPHVGNSAFADYYDGLGVDTYRLVNIYDLVPMVPPDWLGYTTVGAEATYGADYETEAEKHDACCSYAYALWNPTAPFNNDMSTCQSENGGQLQIG
jgi:hypothetical protein